MLCTTHAPGPAQATMNPLFGIVLVVVATLAFTLMAALVRFLGQEIPLGEVVFARSVFALIPLLGMILWRGELATALRTNNPVGHFSRSAVGAFGMFLNFGALALLPLADATAISFATPIFSVVLAAVFLGEVIRVRRWSAVGVGFVGVLVMLSPHLDIESSAANAVAVAGATFGLVGAFFSACSSVQTRSLARSETTSSSVLYFSIICAIAGLVTLPFGWLVPTWPELAALITIGIFGGLAHIFLTESYRLAEASLVAPFDYTSLLWALILGYLVFSELPDPLVFVGAAIIAAAGLFVIWRERQLGLQRARAEAPSATT